MHVHTSSVLNRVACVLVLRCIHTWRFADHDMLHRRHRHRLHTCTHRSRYVLLCCCWCLSVCLSCRLWQCQ